MMASSIFGDEQGMSEPLSALAVFGRGRAVQSEVGVSNFATVVNRKINIYFTGLQIILIGGQIQAAMSSTPTH